MYCRDFKLNVLHKIDDGMKKVEASKLFGVSRSTIDDWFDLREKTNDVVYISSVKKGRTPKISDQELERLTEFLIKNKEKTLVELALLWGNLSSTSMWRAIQKCGYTKKKDFWFKRTIRRKAKRISSKIRNNKP